MRFLRILCKYAVLFTIGGTVYCGIECLWRGYSHISMVIVGGVCFVLIDEINEFLSWETPLLLQMLIAAGIITTVEFFAGCVLNLWLGLGVWDYSALPLNVLGQICPMYFFLWFALSPVGIILADFVRWKLCGEEKPRYKVI